MNPFARPPLGQLLRESGADPDALTAAGQALERAHDEALPWYIRAATGFGAWVAACMALSFLGLIGIFGASGLNAVLSIGMAFAGVRLAGQRMEFLRQLGMALGLCAQGLLLFSLARLEVGASQIALAGMFAAALMFVFHPDPAHRFVCAAGVLAGLLSLAALHDAPRAGEIVILVAVAAAAWAGRTRPFAWTGPGRYGLLVTSLFVLCLSLGGEWRARWLSDLSGFGFTAMLGVFVWAELAGLGARLPARGVAVVGLGLVAWLSRLAPGVPAALLVLGLAVRERDRLMLALGVVFLGLFLAGYYYSLALPLWHKAALLMGGGALALGVRLFVTPREPSP